MDTHECDKVHTYWWSWVPVTMKPDLGSLRVTESSQYSCLRRKLCVRRRWLFHSGLGRQWYSSFLWRGSTTELKVWQMQLFFTKTEFQILHPQNQRSARAGPNLKSLLRDDNIWCVLIDVNLLSSESMNKQHKRLPGVRLSTSVLIRWDGWLSTNSNIGRPLQLETFSRGNKENSEPEAQT